MEVISKLGIGPMSSEVVEAVFRCSEETQQPLMLIASPNQINRKGGYVNGWTTKEYVRYVEGMRQRYRGARIFLCRDHCGPGFGDLDTKEAYRAFDDDLKCGFDLIHVDFCHYPGSDEEILRESGRAIQYITQNSPRTLIEVGTDENNGHSFRDLREVEKQIKYFNTFCQPHFYVGQTGSLVKEVGQQGAFDQKYVEGLRELSRKHKVALKEHNADYLSKDQIAKRRGFIDAMNIAPQYGALQTMELLKACITYGVDPNEFLEVAYDSRRWDKWLHHSGTGDRLLCAILAGHYNFTDSSYQKLCDQIEQHEQGDFREKIIQSMMRNIKMYLDNLK